jgi:outer membrane protein assembly factor BamE (lipoprotein component of BamABCDE complex)
MADKVDKEPYYVKDFGQWGGANDHDIVTNQELTVTITLNEYRELVTKNAGHAEEVSKLQAEASKERQRANTLQNRIEQLLDNDDDEDEDND